MPQIHPSTEQKKLASPVLLQLQWCSYFLIASISHVAEIVYSASGGNTFEMKFYNIIQAESWKNIPLQIGISTTFSNRLCVKAFSD